MVGGEVKVGGEAEAEQDHGLREEAHAEDEVGPFLAEQLPEFVPQLEQDDRVQDGGAQGVRLGGTIGGRPPAVGCWRRADLTSSR